jgi:hypothetical protein
MITQTRQENGTNEPRLLFLYDAISAMRDDDRPRILAGCVRAASPWLSTGISDFYRKIDAKNRLIAAPSHQRFLNANCRY